MQINVSLSDQRTTRAARLMTRAAPVAIQVNSIVQLYKDIQMNPNAQLYKKYSGESNCPIV